MGDRRALALCLLCVLAGCTAIPGISSEATPSPTSNGTAAPTATAATTAGTATAGGTATGTGPATTAGTAAPTATPADFAVEYVVAGGGLPDGVASLTVDFEVVFAQRADDLDYCVGALFSSEYEPTATPLPSPVGECRSVTGLTVNLTALNGTRSLGPFVSPGRFDGAHALVVNDAVAVYDNGTRVTDIHDIDFIAHSQDGRDPGYYGVQIGVTDQTAPGEPWQYAVVTRTFDPGVAVGTPTPAGNATGTPAGTPANDTTGTPTSAPTDTSA
jgi:hypothetical protein